MSTKQSLIVGGAIIVGCLILGLSFGDLAAGQISTPPVAAGALSDFAQGHGKFDDGVRV